MSRDLLADRDLRTAFDLLAAQPGIELGELVRASGLGDEGAARALHRLRTLGLVDLAPGGGLAYQLTEHGEKARQLIEKVEGGRIATNDPAWRLR